MSDQTRTIFEGRREYICMIFFHILDLGLILIHFLYSLNHGDITEWGRFTIFPIKCNSLYEWNWFSYHEKNKRVQIGATKVTLTRRTIHIIIFEQFLVRCSNVRGSCTMEFRCALFWAQIIHENSPLHCFWWWWNRKLSNKNIE